MRCFGMCLAARFARAATAQLEGSAPGLGSFLLPPHAGPHTVAWGYEKMGGMI